MCEVGGFTQVGSMYGVQHMGILPGHTLTKQIVWSVVSNYRRKKIVAVMRAVNTLLKCESIHMSLMARRTFLMTLSFNKMPYRTEWFYILFAAVR